MSINTFFITGNLGDDAVYSHTAKGTSVLEISVGVNGSKPDGNGGYESTVDWLKVTIFGRRAEGLHKSGVLKKGVKVAVEGHLKKNTWQTADGENRSAVGLVADDLDIMSPKQ